MKNIYSKKTSGGPGNQNLEASKMAKETKVSALAVLALILGIGGLGFGAYLFYSTQIGSHVHQTYSDSVPGPYTSGSEDSWYDIPGLNISVSIDAGEQVHVLFTCQATLTAVSAVTYMHFGLKLDGSSVAGSVTSVGATGITSTANMYSVSLQFVFSSLAAGAHVISVETMRECSGNIAQCMLFVQTYIP
jgi:hypothetical protein